MYSACPRTTTNTRLGARRAYKIILDPNQMVATSKIRYQLSQAQARDDHHIGVRKKESFSRESGDHIVAVNQAEKWLTFIYKRGSFEKPHEVVRQHYTLLLV